MKRRVVILGATGSIGQQALDVVRAHPERFEVVGLAAGRDARGLARCADEFDVEHLALADPDSARELRTERPHGSVRDGHGGVCELAGMQPADLVVNGITGAQGLGPTLSALDAGTPVALANKESLIVGGDLVVAAAEAAGGRASHLLPVDSEHSALAQCLRAGRPAEVHRLVLTASGGPFRGRTRAALEAVTPEDALSHPTWDMGPMVTVNSATLMNKGLELIEAHLLFDVEFERLDVVIHPESIVHSMVEFVDGSTIAQLSPPDMRLPIQLAMTWPDRLGRAFAAMDWSQATSLRFEPVDHATFPAVGLAVRAGRERGTYPAALNAANEQAVAAFLAGSLPFTAITEVVETVLDHHEPAVVLDRDDVEEADREARRRADELISTHS